MSTDLVVIHPVFFMGAVHPAQSAKLSYDWFRKGQDKLIETTGSRSRLTAIQSEFKSDRAALESDE